MSSFCLATWCPAAENKTKCHHFNEPKRVGLGNFNRFWWFNFNWRDVPAWRNPETTATRSYGVWPNHSTMILAVLGSDCFFTSVSTFAGTDVARLRVQKTTCQPCRTAGVFQLQYRKISIGKSFGKEHHSQVMQPDTSEYNRLRKVKHKSQKSRNIENQNLVTDDEG